MLLQNILKEVPVILGSKSPRRNELLKSMDIDFSIEVRETDESFDKEWSAVDTVKYIAETKLLAFNDVDPSHLIICADTIVVDQNGKVIGKPQDLAEAKDVILALSGREHQVYTAVAFSYLGQKISFVEETKVWFNKLSEEEVAYYVDRYNPLDKAGSYGIQEWIGRIAIERIEGSYENVIGLPTARLHKALKELFI